MSCREIERESWDLVFARDTTQKARRDRFLEYNFETFVLLLLIFPIRVRDFSVKSGCSQRSSYCTYCTYRYVSFSAGKNVNLNSTERR